MMQEGRRRWQEAAGPGVGVGVEDIGAPQWGRGWSGGWGGAAPGKCQELLSLLDQGLFLFCRWCCSQEAPTGALSASGLSLCLDAFVLLLYTLQSGDQTHEFGACLPGMMTRWLPCLMSLVTCGEQLPQSLFSPQPILPLFLGAKWWNPCTEMFNYLNKKSPWMGHFLSSSILWKIRLFFVWQSHCCKWW